MRRSRNGESSHDFLNHHVGPVLYFLLGLILDRMGYINRIQFGAAQMGSLGASRRRENVGGHGHGRYT